MITFVHAAAHCDADAVRVLRSFAGHPASWLGATHLGGDRYLLPLAPPGVLPEPQMTTDVGIRVGIVHETPRGLIRRLAYEAPGMAPEVRCDLEVSPSLRRGCRLTLRGSYRPPLLSETAAAAEEIAEGIAVALVQHVARVVVTDTLTA